jgi:hypothetical protein
MLITDPDIPKNVNFAIRASIGTSFMDANEAALRNRERRSIDGAGGLGGPGERR